MFLSVERPAEVHFLSWQHNAYQICYIDKMLIGENEDINFSIQPDLTIIVD